MAISKIKTQSCCGSSTQVYETSKPIRKHQIGVFRDAGYMIPDNWFQLGIFWVKKDNLIVSASYGSAKFQVRCGGDRCSELLKSFETLLEQAINS